MSDSEYSMYRLGREARRFGYGRNACNLPTTRRVQRCWWLAGWHDEDMELENLRLLGYAA